MQHRYNRPELISVYENLFLNIMHVIIWQKPVLAYIVSVITDGFGDRPVLPYISYSGFMMKETQEYGPQWRTDTSDPGQFGSITFRHHQTDAEVSGHFGTTAEVSGRQFDTGTKLS